MPDREYSDLLIDRATEMKTTPWVVLLVLLSSVHADDRVEISLWPDGMPEPVVPAEPAERIEKGQDGLSRRFNVSKPRLIVHAVPSGVAKSGAAVIVIPGGGFARLSDEHEGSDICRWLNDVGIVAFQLVHRSPTNRHAEPFAGPVQDVQKAVTEVRNRAAEYGIQPDRIGVIGFSAGGQAALFAATNQPVFDRSANAPSHKPDFQLLIYPYQIYDAQAKALRKEVGVENGLVPTFMAQMGDDTASLAQGCALLYVELINRKVPAELHIYERGGHGFGIRARPNAVGPSDWSSRAADWLRLHGFAAPAGLVN